ncbi:MAG: hypothetical protein WDN04_16280 [Rhodospirillales bacterium]
MLLLAHTEMDPPKVVALDGRQKIHDMLAAKQLAGDAMLYAVLKKAGSESAFRIPVQEYYAG